MRRFVAAILGAPGLVIAAAVLLLCGGLFAYRQLAIEAYPNPVAPMIEIITQPSGWSAEEVERYVTIPLENALAGMVDLEHVRSQSLFGLSDVKCYFSWNADFATAQQRVINRLQFVQLPPGVQPQLSPWSAIGEIYRYVVRGKSYSLAERKTAQDWILQKELRTVPGVADVVGFGGETRQYQVEIDPFRLRSHGLTLQQISTAIANANQNAGGQRLTMGEQSFNVRAMGLITSDRDVGNVVVSAPHGTAVRVRDVAEVKIAAAPRLGLVGKDLEDDVVQGIVLMRYGGDSLKTLRAVHEKIRQIREKRLLPPGMELEPYYDRERLVKLTTHTVIENLLVGMLLVTVVLFVFLGSKRAALVTAANIPLALLAAFIGLVATGTPANLISLGAVDFGIVVESTVILVENIFRHLGKGAGTLHERIAAAASEIASPLLFSTLVITVAFVPLFTMSGVAGVIFSPMATTYAFAIGGAVLLSLTLTPVLASKVFTLPPPGEDGHHDTKVLQAIDKFYKRVFRFGLRHKPAAVALGVLPVVAAIAMLPLLGREFMPKLEEGNFWIRATLPMSISLEQSGRYVGRMRSIVLGCPQNKAGCDLSNRRYPEIDTVVSQVGRPDDGTDVSGFHNIELFAPLKPRGEWRSGVTKIELTEQLSHELRDAFPGVVFNFSQAISDNVEEAMSGVKGENTVKVVGPDLRLNEAKAQEIVAALGGVRGVDDLGMFHTLGQPDIRIVPDREACGRYGLNVGDVEGVVQGAIGGQVVTQVFEGEKRFDLVVRWAPAFRKDLSTIRSILVPTPDGAQVPLGQLAAIAEDEGPSVVYREDNRRYAPVKFSVRGRDLGSTITEAQGLVTDRVKLPYGTHLEWGGEMDELQAAVDRLLIVVPLTLLLIGFLVFSAVKRWADMGIVLLGVPLACSGGLLALLATGTTMSISAAMGFVSLLGIAVQDALLVVTYAKRLWADGASLEDGARLAAERGLRPTLMTACVALIGLLPAAVSNGIGSETQKPLAIVVIGGALALAILPRLLQPPLLVWAHRRDGFVAVKTPTAAASVP